ncbi:MAG: RodZ domain-containing protein, partial [Acidiferrobacterales bacterium]
VTAQGDAVQSQAAGEQRSIQAEKSVAPESGASSTTSRASPPTAAAIGAVPAAPAVDDAGLGESAARERSQASRAPTESTTRERPQASRAPTESTTRERPQASRAPTESAARPETASLILHAHGASWADVRDARGNRLVYTVVPAGRRITLTGTPPFSVFLGNPDGVVLEFNGQRLDAAKFKRGLVARFTVDVSKPSGN